MELDERTPPHDIAAEQIVLGGMLLAKDAITDACELLRAVDFYHPKHGLIFDAIRGLDASGEPTDPAAVAARLLDSGELARVGGAEYLTDLTGSVITAANTAWFAKRVAGLAAKRRLIECGTRITAFGFHPEITPDDAVERAQVDLHNVTVHKGDSSAVMWSDLATEVLDRIEEYGKRGDGLRGVSTGLMDLDLLTGGWTPGQLVVFAGRPGMGKSVALVDAVRTASIRHGLTAVLFSLEMSRQEVGERITSAETGVPLHVVQSGALEDDDWARIAKRFGDLDHAKLIIDDAADLTLSTIRSRARRIQQRHGLDLIAVDYLQLLTTASRSENRQQEVSEISRGLKLLAKELKVPVIAAAQLNRQSEQRSDKRPHLSDLRESGSVEQDSDVVVLLHRDDYYDKESPRAGEADFIVAKNRHGATDTITVAAQLHRSRFVDLAIPAPRPKPVDPLSAEALSKRSH